MLSPSPFALRQSEVSVKNSSAMALVAAATRPMGLLELACELEQLGCDALCLDRKAGQLAKLSGQDMQ